MDGHSCGGKTLPVECGFIQHVGEGGEAWWGGPGLYGRSIGINLTESSSTSVGAREVGSGGEGLYGRPRPVPLAHLWGNALTPQHRATIGTYPSCQRCCTASKEVWGTSAEHSGKTKGARSIRPPPNRPRPHGIPGSRLRLMPIAGPLWSPAVPLKYGDPNPLRGRSRYGAWMNQSR